MTRTSSLLASCLARLGWSPEQLAREINKRYGTGTISNKAPYNWLQGSLPRRQLPHLIAEILTDQLGEPITAEALWPRHFPDSRPQGPVLIAPSVLPTPDVPHTSTGPVSAAVDWLVDTGSASPSRSGGSEVPDIALDMLTTRIGQLRKVDDIASTRLAMDWALQDMQSARKLAAEHSYDTQTGLQLHRIIAELAQLAGWLAADLGLRRRSQSYFLYGLATARTAQDRPLAAYIISCMSYCATWETRQEEGLRLIRIARKGSCREDFSIGHALLATREARALARLGDKAGCVRALNEAADLSQDNDSSADAPWLSWVSPPVMVADAGRAWLELGDYRRAEQCLERGLELFGESQPRNRMLHWASLAEARLGREEFDGAVEAADEALSLAEVMTSQRAQVRLADLRRKLKQYDSAAAREVVQRVDVLLGTDRLRVAS
ncbi:M48 family metallopeptidase [Streptomyces griseus]|uniref:tetratricopeptide repeat protein n=1 Tax=Streptomyces griseus TaxID=1911 RepID=UPI00055FF234|nr:tetratricopeptide repeat protein [Streptomyces griseus]